MQKFPRCWSILDKINYLQRKIILSSILYYENNESPISDREYDELSKQLIELTNGYEDRENTQYWYCFYDFDGTTGFDLSSRLNEHDNIYLHHLALLFGGERKVETKKNNTVKKGKLF